VGHGHAHRKLQSAAGQNKRRLAIVLGLTTIYLIAEVVGGLLKRSLALLADAGHMKNYVELTLPILYLALACGSIFSVVGKRCHSALYPPNLRRRGGGHVSHLYPAHYSRTFDGLFDNHISHHRAA